MAMERKGARRFVVFAVAGAVAGSAARTDAGEGTDFARTMRAALGGFHTGWTQHAGAWTATRRQAELYVEAGPIAAGATLELRWRRAAPAVTRVTVFWNRAVVHSGPLPKEETRASIALPPTSAGRQEIGFDFGGARKFRAVMGGARRQRGKLEAGRPLAVVKLDAVPGEIVPSMDPPAGCATDVPSVNLVANLPPHKNVLFYVVDTLRGDHVGRETHGVKTPNFNRIAANGIAFARAVATSSWSKPTIATLLTARHPGAHGCNAHDDKLAATKALSTLAEGFRAKGNATAAVVANGYIAAQHGFVRGFDFVKNPLREGRPYRAERLNEIALKWLRTLPKEKPFFLHMQPVDPHVPYNPPRRFWAPFFEGRYAGPLIPAKTGDQLDLVKSRALRLGARDRAFLHALYDGAVEYTDFAFGELMKALDAIGRAQDTLVVITADHGEEFWEHGSVGHAHSVYDELVRVPFIAGSWGMLKTTNDPDSAHQLGKIRASDALERVMTATVSMVDLMRGLRRLYGFDLGPAIGSGVGAYSVVRDRVATVTWGVCKYILWRGGDEELFRLDRDPGEKMNLARAERDVARSLRARLSEWFAGDRPAHGGE